MKVTKGIILAGGSGSRLFPLTAPSNKQTLPIFDKPVIFYPLTTLMLAGIEEILIISTPKDTPGLKDLLGNGQQWGINITYQVQQEPKGLPDAFILGEKFINDEPVAMILGDNFFHGNQLSGLVFEKAKEHTGATIFTYRVPDAERFGVAVIDDKGKVLNIEEKPKKPKSNLAITGLYFFDETVSKRAKKLKPSARHELEITDLINTYLKEGKLSASVLGRGQVWMDVGTPNALLNASNYVHIIQSQQGVIIASPEEVAWRMEFISDRQFEKLVKFMPNGHYKTYLEGLLK